MGKRRAALSGQLGDVDIRTLRIFRAVVENGGFSAAEVELGISTSAISMAISDLESRLRMKLCQRGRAGFSLTDEGSQVFDATLRLLSSLENFRAEVNGIHEQLRGDLNIAVTDNLVTMHRHMRVTDSLAALKRRGPEVRINIRMMPPADIQKGVLDGRIHVGVIPDLNHLAGLNYLDLYDEDSQLYCGSSHALFATEDEALSEELILQQDAVLASASVPASAGHFIRQLQGAATATDREGIAFLILSGEYVGFLPDHYAERWVRDGRMRALLPDTFSYQTRFSAITRKGARPNLVLSTYLEELLQPR